MPGGRCSVWTGRVSGCREAAADWLLILTECGESREGSVRHHPGSGYSGHTQHNTQEISDVTPASIMSQVHLYHLRFLKTRNHHHHRYHHIITLTGSDRFTIYRQL